MWGVALSGLDVNFNSKYSTAVYNLHITLPLLEGAGARLRLEFRARLQFPTFSNATDSFSRGPMDTESESDPDSESDSDSSPGRESPSTVE